MQRIAWELADFAADDDPIAPAGIRDQGLFESAVNRQHTGYAGRVKYENALTNAASLAYGVCCDHAFHNGNKRAALVALLVHLDRNEYGLPGVSQDDLYRLMIANADHQLATRKALRNGRVLGRPAPDDEVVAIAEWLRGRAQKIERGEKIITYRELRRNLSRLGFDMVNAGQNTADIMHEVEVKKGLFRRRREVERRRVMTVGYRDEGTTVARGYLRRIRENCKLTEEDGCDSQSFYAAGERIDAFVLRYRRVLRRLSKK